MSISDNKWNKNLMNNIINNLSRKEMTFLFDIPKRIHINKNGKSHYFKFFRMNLLQIENFILSLADNQAINSNVENFPTIGKNYVCYRQRFLDSIQSFGDYNHLSNLDIVAYNMNVEWYFSINNTYTIFLFNLHDYDKALTFITKYLWVIFNN